MEIDDISFSVSGGDYIDNCGNLVVEKYNLAYNNLFVYNIAATKELDIEVQKLKEENKILKMALNNLLQDLGKPQIIF